MAGSSATLETIIVETRGRVGVPAFSHELCKPAELGEDNNLSSTGTV
jgi:hypothetical protein